MNNPNVTDSPATPNGGSLQQPCWKHEPATSEQAERIITNQGTIIAMLTMLLIFVVGILVKISTLH